MVGHVRDSDEPVATEVRAGTRDVSVPAQVPDHLVRVARIGHSMLRSPVQVVAISDADGRVVQLAATPQDSSPVPERVARQLSTSTSATTATAVDGSQWAGAAVTAWGSTRVVICATAVQDGGHTRAALTDLAALASDVLSLDDARRDAADLRELLGAASHDLRNPLSVLRAGLETLTLHGDDLPDGQTERIADLAIRQANRMCGMIDGLLSLNGLDGDTERERIDLRGIVRDAVEAGRLSHEDAEIHLADLPTAAVPTVGVPDLLARALTNLVSNAATHGGGSVSVSLAVHRSEATISVSDDGPGMPGDSALDTGERAGRRGGHGLGLVITKRILAAHDGSVGYHDRDGGGTVVQLTVPLEN